MATSDEIVQRLVPPFIWKHGGRLYEREFERSPFAFMLDPVEAAGGREEALKLVFRLLDRGIIFDAMWQDTTTVQGLFAARAPIHILARRNAHDWIDVLAEVGVDLNNKCVDWEMTPLFHALQCNALDSFVCLLRHGADVKIRNRGTTVMHFAAAMGLHDCFELICAAGLDYDVRDDTSRSPTPLHSAAFKNNACASAELVRLGVDVNVKDANGTTPLALAVSQGHKETAFRLIEVGASLSARDRSGHSIPDIAETHGQTSLMTEINAYAESRKASSVINDTGSLSLRSLTTLS